MTTPAASARKAAVLAAMDVAEDLAAGRLNPAQLDAAVVAECTALAGTVAAGDPLWDLHVSVARQVLALDGIPVDELAEWLAVTRAAQGVAEAEVAPSWIETALAQMADDDEDEGSVSEL